MEARAERRRVAERQRELDQAAATGRAGTGQRAASAAMGCGASSEAPACPAQALTAPAAGSDSAGADDAAGGSEAVASGETRPTGGLALAAWQQRYAAVNRHTVVRFMEITGGDETTARCTLQSVDWDLQRAIDRHLEAEPEGEPELTRAIRWL